MFNLTLQMALAMIPTTIISFIIKEREQQLKHMQLVSGVSLAAYWVSNVISDMLKTYLPILLMIGLSFAFELSYEGVWEFLLLYPITIVPFTYFTSLYFKTDTVA